MDPSQQKPVTLSDAFVECLQGVAQDVEHTLETLLPPPTTHLHEAMRYSVLGGGKRLRAFLVVESSQLFRIPSSQALRAAAALELIQAYSLIHDDLPCMDNADFRRGKPSCHSAFGEATATLVGDALIPLAFQTLATLDTSYDIRLSLIERLAHAIGSQGLVAGQMMDLGQEGPLQSYEDLCEQERLKTGVLFSFAAETGAILGKASLDEREALKSFGLLFGKAFQMVDDWLDVYGHEETMGKPCGQDGEKLTFLNLLGPTLLQEKIESTVLEALDCLAPFHAKASLLKEAILSIVRPSTVTVENT
jgi:farnesyl diphosphate synthase